MVVLEHLCGNARKTWASTLKFDLIYSNFTLAIIFEPEDIGFKRPFNRYQYYHNLGPWTDCCLLLKYGCRCWANTGKVIFIKHPVSQSEIIRESFFLCPYVKWWHIIFVLSVCWSVSLWLTWTFAIMFEPEEIKWCSKFTNKALSPYIHPRWITLWPWMWPLIKKIALNVTFN